MFKYTILKIDQGIIKLVDNETKENLEFVIKLAYHLSGKYLDILKEDFSMIIGWNVSIYDHDKLKNIKVIAHGALVFQLVEKME